MSQGKKMLQMSFIFFRQNVTSDFGVQYDLNFTVFMIFTLKAHCEKAHILPNDHTTSPAQHTHTHTLAAVLVGHQRVRDR